MFDQSIPYYDRIYAKKDYAAEAARLVEIVDAHLRSGGRRLLDVACGTGRHLEYLKARFEAEGLDLAGGMLAIARERHPDLTFHQGDMRDFDLGTQFDVITCLFSAIGDLKILDEVRQALATFHGHLVPGGIALVEPWFTPAQWHPDTVHADFIDEAELKIARVNTSYRDGRLSWFDLHYLVGTPEKTEHFVEHHEMGLFETAELQTVFEDVGFETTFDAEGLTGRGLFVGVRPA